MSRRNATQPALRVKLKSTAGARLDAAGVWNISLGGLFVEMAEPLAFGEDVQLEFDFTGQALPLVCRGFVVWSTRDSPDKGGGRTGSAIRLTEVGIAEMRTIAARVGQDL